VSTGYTPLDEQITQAVRDGVRAEAAPVGRHLAEVRGLSVRAIRQLDRIEQVAGAERTARVEDLSALVDLISASWRTVDDRLARIEELLGGDERVEVIAIADANTLPGDELDSLDQPHADAA